MLRKSRQEVRLESLLLMNHTVMYFGHLVDPLGGISVSILFILYNTPTETTPCAVSKLATGMPPNTNGENYNTAILISTPDALRLIRHM